MSATCSGCGACCEVIPLPVRLADIQPGTVYDSPADTAFLLAHWHEMDRATAERMNPGMTGGLSPFFYRCDAYDPLSRVCTAHATRPEVCRGFPFYDGPPRIDALRPFPRCSFWADIPEAERPPYVQLTRTPA